MVKSILRRDIIQSAYVFGIFSLTIGLLLYINNLLLSSVLAFVVVYLMTPIVMYFERKGYPRTLSIFVIYSIALAALTLLGMIFVPILLEQVKVLETELPNLQNGLNALVGRLENRLQSFSSSQDFFLTNKLSGWVVDQVTHTTSMLPSWVSDSLTTLFLAPFLAFFMLRDGTTVKHRFLRLIPNRYFELSMNLLHEMNDQIGKFIRARIAEAAIVGVVTWAGLFFCDFPYAILFALFAAITNLIPYLGPVAGAIPPIILVLVNPEMVFGSLGLNLFALAIIYLTAQLLDAFVIIPVVVAKIVDLHPVTVILVIILGAQLMGILGMIISIPVASLGKLILSTVYQHSIRTSSTP